MSTGRARLSPGAVASSEQWVESDRQRDAARSLEMVNAQLVTAAVDPYSWTWVLLSVRRAIRAFIAASAGGAPAAISSPLSGLRVRGGGDPGSAGGPADLADRYQHALAASGLEVLPAVAEEIDRLAHLCHEMFERTPDGWALRLNDLPRTTRSCLKGCEQLGWSPGLISWSDDRVARLARDKYAGSVRILDALDIEYNGN